MNGAPEMHASRLERDLRHSVTLAVDGCTHSVFETTIHTVSW